MGERMVDLAAVAERARLVRQDTATDAAAIDRTPFTPQGIGPLFENLLAMIAALAKCIEELAEVPAPRDKGRYALDEHGRLAVPLREE